jgi:hypothetical protein
MPELTWHYRSGAADCQCVASGAVVHLLLPHSGWTYCVPMDEDREDSGDDQDEYEGQGEDLQLIHDRSECVYAFHSSEAQLAQALSHGRAIPRIQVAVP